MIKQLCMDIWMENKRNPKEMVWRFFCIVLTLFLGVLVPGAPYTFLFAIFPNNNNLINSMDNRDKISLQPEITYLIPCPPFWIKQYEIGKCLVRALFYGSITIVGYIFTIQSWEQLQFDKEMVLLLVWIFIYVFFIVFIMNLHKTIARYLNLEYMYTRCNFAKGAIAIHFCGYILTSFLTIAFLYIKFATESAQAFWQHPIRCVIVFTAAFLGVAMFLLDVRYSVKRLVIGDYCG